MATNEELQVDAWHDRTFGGMNIPATYRKLLEEIGELGEALMRHDSAAVEEEIGDCQMVMRHILRGAANGNRSLSQTMMVSLDKCETRRHKAKAAKGAE